MNLFDSALFGSAIRMSTPLVLAAIGGLYSERSGVVNIALEGCMLFGAFTSAVVTLFVGDPWIGMAAGTLAGGMIAALHALISVSFKGDQIVSGMAINILALGAPSLFCSALFHTPSSSPSVANTFPVIAIPFLHQIPLVGPILFQHAFHVYAAWMIVFLTDWILWRTVFGLRLRAVGENPAAAEALGIRVHLYRYYGVILSGLLAGFSGTFLSIGHGSQFIKNMTAGRGYIALAALIFGKWKPWQTMGACCLFGIADALQMRLQGMQALPLQFIQMIPYILTIVVLIGFIGKSSPPAAAGKPY